MPLKKSTPKCSNEKILLYAYIAIAWSCLLALVLLAFLKGHDVPAVVYGGLIGAFWSMGKKSITPQDIKKIKDKFKH